MFALLNIFTGGGFFLNTVTANLNDFRWERVSLNALGALLACPLLPRLAVLVLTPREGTVPGGSSHLICSPASPPRCSSARWVPT